MMKRSTLFIAVAGICAVLAVSLLMCLAQDKDAKPARPNFVPSPVFSPPYPPLPHNFGKTHTIQILCQAPKGAIKRAIMQPLDQNGDDDLFVILLGWSPECVGGYNVHEISINAPVKWKSQTGNTTLIEYIDSDMGLITGREVWGWAKKMADITWTQTSTGWKITCKKLKDQKNAPLMEIEYKISDSTPEVKWPDMGPVMLVKRIPPASATVSPLTQLVCIGCNRPRNVDPAFVAAAKGSKNSKGSATVKFFDAPYDPLTFLGPIKVLDAKMRSSEGSTGGGGLGLGDVIYEWKE